MHEGEEGHAWPGWTTSRHGQDSTWKSQSKSQRIEINGESTSMPHGVANPRIEDGYRTEQIIVKESVPKINAINLFF